MILPTGEVYRVQCQADGNLRYRRGDVEIAVDNRGRAGFIEQVFGAILLRSEDLAKSAK